jgi:hypothetical protein
MYLIIILIVLCSAVMALTVVNPSKKVANITGLFLSVAVITTLVLWTILYGSKA